MLTMRELELFREHLRQQDPVEIARWAALSEEEKLGEILAVLERRVKPRERPPGSEIGEEPGE